MKRARITAYLLTTTLTAGTAALAPLAGPGFDLTWHTIDGGGGTSSGGGFVLSGTIGQPDAGVAMTGGGFELIGGNWPAAASIPCPWDCGGNNDGTVGIVDFLTLLAEWSVVGTPCDFDGGGVGINDFLELLGNWGPCP